MRIGFVLFFLWVKLNSNSQPIFQLAPPILKYSSAFFADSTRLEIVFKQPGAEVRYTLNGSEPTEQDFIYSKALSIAKNTTVRARAFGKQFSASETVSASFVKDGKGIFQINYAKPNESYSGKGTNILHDNIGGLCNFKSNTWLGYNSDTVEINIELRKQDKIKAVLINFLQDENNWIFLPEQVVLYYYNQQQADFLKASDVLFLSEGPAPNQCSMQVIKPKKKFKTNKLKLLLFPVKKIPDWHQGVGGHGWLFIDEIKVY